MSDLKPGNIILDAEDLDEVNLHDLNPEDVDITVVDLDQPEYSEKDHRSLHQFLHLLSILRITQICSEGLQYFSTL